MARPPGIDDANTEALRRRRAIRLRKILIASNLALISGLLLAWRMARFDHEWDDSWADEHRMVAHALGGIDATSYTNSREAFVSNYDLGFRVFEVDLEFTADSHLVAIHDPASPGPSDVVAPPTLAELQASANHGPYLALSANELMQLLLDHQDAYLILDTKGEPLPMVRRSVELANDVDPRILDRMIPQLYDSDVEALLAIHPFRSVILTLYRTDADNDQVVYFVERTGVGAVTMPANRADHGFVQRLSRRGVRVFVHTVNDLDQATALLERGVYGFYTDFLPPKLFELP